MALLHTEIPPTCDGEAAPAASLPTFTIEFHGPYGTWADAVHWTRDQAIGYAERRLLRARPGTTITVFAFEALGEPTAIWSRKACVELAGGLSTRIVYRQRVEIPSGRQVAR